MKASFDRRITPEESFEKEIVFDLPENMKYPRLDIRKGEVVMRAFENFLIGDEDSVYHGRNYFGLGEGQ